MNGKVYHKDFTLQKKQYFSILKTVSLEIPFCSLKKRGAYPKYLYTGWIDLSSLIVNSNFIWGVSFKTHFPRGYNRIKPLPCISKFLALQIELTPEKNKADKKPKKKGRPRKRRSNSDCEFELKISYDNNTVWGGLLKKMTDFLTENQNLNCEFRRNNTEFVKRHIINSNSEKEIRLAKEIIYYNFIFYVFNELKAWNPDEDYPEHFNNIVVLGNEAISVFIEKIRLGEIDNDPQALMKIAGFYIKRTNSELQKNSQILSKPDVKKIYVFYKENDIKDFIPLLDSYFFTNPDVFMGIDPFSIKDQKKVIYYLVLKFLDNSSEKKIGTLLKRWKLIKAETKQEKDKELKIIRQNATRLYNIMDSFTQNELQELYKSKKNEILSLDYAPEDSSHKQKENRGTTFGDMEIFSVSLEQSKDKYTEEKNFYSSVIDFLKRKKQELEISNAQIQELTILFGRLQKTTIKFSRTDKNNKKTNTRVSQKMLYQDLKSITPDDVKSYIRYFFKHNPDKLPSKYNIAI